MWLEKGNNYFENKMGDCLLIVEKNDTKKFEWSFFRKGYKIDGTNFDGLRHATKEDAKKSAEKAYIKYKQSR